MTLRRPGASSQAGYSLMEAMVTVTLLTLVLGVVYDTFSQTLRHEAEVVERIKVQNDGRSAVDQMVRDLRQAYTGDEAIPVIATMSATSLTFYSPDRATPHHLRRITYALSGGDLVMSVTSSSDTDGPPWVFATAPSPAPLLRDVVNAVSFEYRDSSGAVTTSPAAVSVVDLTLVVDTDPDRSPGPQIYSTTINLRATR